MLVGRFFSLGKGRVGQYLSSRVLVVRTPFRSTPRSYGSELCCFGFDLLSQAQKFARYLAKSGYRFQICPGQMMPQFAYEVQLWGNTDLPRMLAGWDRLDQNQIPPRVNRPVSAIAA